MRKKNLNNLFLLFANKYFNKKTVFAIERLEIHRLFRLIIIELSQAKHFGEMMLNFVKNGSKMSCQNVKIHKL